MNQSKEREEWKSQDRLLVRITPRTTRSHAFCDPPATHNSQDALWPGVERIFT